MCLEQSHEISIRSVSFGVPGQGTVPEPIGHFASDRIAVSRKRAGKWKPKPGVVSKVELEIDTESPWPKGDWPGLAERGARAVGQVAPELADERLSASLLFTADAEILALNRQWRGRDKATNVLSFPMLTRDELLALAAEGPPVMLGDIALAHESCTREAGDKGISLEHHVAHLIVHGLLHLAGYDHETGAGDAARMEALEIEALALMGVSDPYG